MTTTTSGRTASSVALAQVCVNTIKELIDLWHSRQYEEEEQEEEDEDHFHDDHNHFGEDGFFCGSGPNMC